MKLRTLTLSIPLLLMLTAPVRAQTVPDAGAASRPLNLSLPRDLARPPAMPSGMEAAQDPVEQNLRPAQVDGRQASSRMPYGSGYEARQRGSAGAGDSASGIRGSNGGGYGGGKQGGGRGGMGRGR